MSTSVDVSLLKRAAEDAANYSRSDDRLPTKESELANNIRSGFLSIRNTVDIKPFASDLADPMKFVLDPKLNDVSLNIHTWLNIVLRQLETLPGTEGLGNAYDCLRTPFEEIPDGIDGSLKAMDAAHNDQLTGVLPASMDSEWVIASKPLFEGPPQWCHNVDAVLKPLHNTRKGQGPDSKLVDIDFVARALKEFESVRALENLHADILNRLAPVTKNWDLITRYLSSKEIREVLYNEGYFRPSSDQNPDVDDTTSSLYGDLPWWQKQQMFLKDRYIDLSYHKARALRGESLPEDFVRWAKYLAGWYGVESPDVVFDNEYGIDWSPAHGWDMPRYLSDMNQWKYPCYVSRLWARLRYLYPRWAAIDGISSIRQLERKLQVTSDLAANLRGVVDRVQADTKEGGFLSQLTEECRDSIDGLVENFSCGSVYEVSDDIRSLDRVLQKIKKWDETRQTQVNRLEKDGYAVLRESDPLLF